MVAVKKLENVPMLWSFSKITKRWLSLTQSFLPPTFLSLSPVSLHSLSPLFPLSSYSSPFSLSFSYSLQLCALSMFFFLARNFFYLLFVSPSLLSLSPLNLFSFLLRLSLFPPSCSLALFSCFWQSLFILFYVVVVHVSSLSSLFLFTMSISSYPFFFTRS